MCVGINIHTYVYPSRFLVIIITYTIISKYTYTYSIAGHYIWQNGDIDRNCLLKS